MSTITKDQEAAIAAKVASMHIPSGIGDKENACTVAAINLALTGRLSGDIPDCMSKVLGGFVIRIQDALPSGLRNSPEYKQLIPLMAGTGRAQEKERLTIILSWMWEVLLPALQPIADARVFRSEWKHMVEKRSPVAARAAAYAANAAARAAAYAANAAADAYAAAAAYAAADAAAAAASAAYAAYAAADAAAAAYAAYAAAAASAASAASADAADFWQSVDIIGLLTRLTFLDEVSK